MITSGPEEGSAQTRSSATFEFRVVGRTYGYQCAMNAKIVRWEDCSKLRTYTASGLGVGKHTFVVRAYDLTLEDSYGPEATRSWVITAIDDDADGSALPADCNDANPAIKPAALEVPGNGVDENCDGLDTLPATPTPEVPTTPAAPAPTPVPTPAPVGQPLPKLAVTLSYFMRANKRDTRFSTLSLKGVPSGATITVKCTGGCPRKTATIKGKRGTVAITAFRNRALKAGAKLTIEVTKPGSVGTSKVVTIRASKRPTIVTKTLS